MNISQNGINLIKKYEGLRLNAYKPVATEKYWTIGYGHYGADVRQGMKITESQAEEYLKKDCQASVNAVNALKLNLNQNQFDALVSFTYNCGSGNLKSLCKGRTVEEIGEKIVLYNKAGGKVLNGLVKRRKEEQELYKRKATNTTHDAQKAQEKANTSVEYYPRYVGNTESIVSALQSLKIDSNIQSRIKIGIANGINNVGTAEGNTRMLNLLKQGKLKKA